MPRETTSRFIRLLSTGLLLLGLGLLGVAAWEYSTADDGPGITIEDSDREVTVDADGQASVVFRVQNHSGRAVRVVSVAEC
jgi:hypothetical protein